ncbi:UNVERIFIED_CONTAM: protein WHAT'S THIS FACTOR 1, chloroplastic [Sesamum latifolium]|uniref:Protein WHAT'S THIS FACTOR 1, chloroplastic n=1 Tax=Sesamum latifolium TaxID=2727402 RepID=A0AAW2TQT2_9LAMI
MSLSKKLPLRAIFKVWRELELADNFEDPVISSNSDIFLLQDGNEPNTHFWCSMTGFPPLKKNFKAKVKEWQRLPYVGPYEELGVEEMRRTKSRMMRMEKSAVWIVHEFLSLIVEKMVEVEKISHFRKWFGIDLNVTDLFLDHPGMFYLSTKGKRHTVFLGRRIREDA